MTAVAAVYDPSSPSRQSRHMAWLDTAKGIGICLVVFGHAGNGLMAAGGWPSGGTLSLVIYVVYTFHMPLFFFLSGITVERSLQKGHAQFLKAKVATIVHPYLVWSLIQGLSQAAVSDSLNNPFKLEYLLLIPISPIGHFWFLYALMLCHVLAAIASGRKGLLVGSTLLALVVCHSLTDLAGMTLYHFPFYAAGILVHRRLETGKIGEVLRSRSGAAAGLLLAATFLAVASASARWTDADYTHPTLPPVAALGIAAVVALSQAPSTWAVARAAAYLGRLSLSIYVMHVMACAGTRIALMKLGFVAYPLATLVLCTMAGLLLPVAAHAVFARLRLLDAFGLRSAPATLRAASTGGAMNFSAPPQPSPKRGRGRTQGA